MVVVLEPVARGLVLLHACSAIALIGSATHSAIIARARVRGDGGDRIACLHAAITATLYVVTMVLGTLAYPTYRVEVRAAWLDVHATWASHLFEIKEHLGTLGIPLAIGAWLLLRATERPERIVRIVSAGMAIGCAAIVWFDVISGLLITMAKSVP